MNHLNDPQIQSAGADAPVSTRPGFDLARWVGSIPNRIRIALKDTQAYQESFSGPTIRERQATLVEFYDRYEETVELLLDAAQFGPNAAMEAKYQRLKAYMTESYPVIRPFALAYLRLSVEDEAFGFSVAGRGTDAFETLTVAESLESVLAHDDGEMISRITRTREALTLYGEHLRYLISKAE